MVTGNSRNRGGYLILIAILSLAAVVGLLALEPPDTLQDALLRGAAWLGYLTVFYAIVSSAYVRQMSRFFGRPFIRVHHIVSVTGLIMITLHPLLVAFRRGTLAVFIPVVTSWRDFLREGGRPAWYLFGVASLAALFRKALGRGWRAVHLLTYLAFWLASAHIILRSEGVHALVAWALALIVALLLIHRYLWQPAVTRRRIGAQR
jgi:DMSO/TMAO reductase YedYZ heme-binding membrane subunit